MKRWLAISIIVVPLLAFFGMQSLMSQPQDESSDETRGQFEERYQALQEYLASGEAGARDPLLTGKGIKLYWGIIKLGPPALPYIIEKIEQGDWRLGGCVLMISKKRFYRSDYADVRAYGDAITTAGMYVEWWHEGRKDTVEQFETLYQQWKDLRGQGQDEGAADKYERIRGLGIAALPYIIKKVEQGDVDLIPLVSRLTSGAGGAPDAISSTASAAECLDWWNKNKQRWTLPPVKSETVSSTP